MKDYKKELDHYEYNKRFKSAREHSLDFLKDKEQVKKFESGLKNSNFRSEKRRRYWTYFLLIRNGTFSHRYS